MVVFGLLLLLWWFLLFLMDSLGLVIWDNLVMVEDLGWLVLVFVVRCLGEVVGFVEVGLIVFCVFMLFNLKNKSCCVLFWLLGGLGI